jgi:2-polyprenyl-6-methoxyphenol hydroxylase-like FAD-dependent oxidoreductase
VLLDEAIRLGAKVKLNAEVVDITAAGSPCVMLHSGEVVSADIIVGADGMSVIDTIHLGRADVDQAFGRQFGILFWIVSASLMPGLPKLLRLPYPRPQKEEST